MTNLSDGSRWALAQGFVRGSSANRFLTPPAKPAPEFATHHSGLPLRFSQGAAVVPEWSTSRRLQLHAKRGLDVTLAVMALFALSPLLISVAIAIRMGSPGPVLFRQLRTGKGNQLFSMFKFRTMYSDLGDQSGVAQTRPGDARVTPLGKLLRKTSIDELPQLLNVVIGNMSLVGPRPHVPEMLAAGVPYHELVPYYSQRHEVLPGITGWAQANGFRGPTEEPSRAWARVNHDLAYVQNFSLWLDLRTLWRTLKNEFFSGTGI